MSASDRYATPAAFRRALTDRLTAAANEGRWTLSQLQRQVAYDRLIERLYLVDDGWIVKGATALLARELGVRGSLDVDLYREASREVAEGELRRVDHVADKVVATYERHGDGARPSTRYRDLVDLVAIVAGATVPAAAQETALRSEFDRRELAWPQTFDVPDGTLWGPGYSAEAARSLLDTARTLDQALALVRPFLDPLLSGTATGSWEPAAGAWITA